MDRLQERLDSPDASEEVEVTPQNFRMRKEELSAFGGLRQRRDGARDGERSA